MESAAEDGSVGFDFQILHQSVAMGENGCDSFVTNGE